MTLLELKKYAIVNRVEIGFGADNSKQCVVSTKGQIKIPGDDKDFRIEDVLAAAERFVIESQGHSQNYARHEMIRMIEEYSDKGRASHDPEEDE